MRNVQILTDDELEDAAIVIVRVDEDAAIDADFIESLRDEIRDAHPTWRGVLLVIPHGVEIEEVGDEDAAELLALLSARLAARAG